MFDYESNDINLLIRLGWFSKYSIAKRKKFLQKKSSKNNYNNRVNVSTFFELLYSSAIDKKDVIYYFKKNIFVTGWNFF